MKKILVALFALASLVSISAGAQQGGGDPAAYKQRMIERVKPQLIEKTKLTDAQADKVLDINFTMQQQRRELRQNADLDDAAKAKKTAEMEADATKQYKAIPLSDDQVKAVNDFFVDMRKNQQQRQNNGGGGGGNK